MKILWEWLQKRWVYHSIIWLLITLFVIGAIDLAEEFKHLKSGTKFTLILYAMTELMTFVYAHFYIKKVFFRHGIYWKYVLAVPLLIVLSYYADKLLVWLFFESIGHLIALDYIEIVGMIISSTALQYFKRGISNQYHFEQLKARTTEMELNSLKTQMNPHFLFNNLNNIYAINQMDSEKGSEMILELSEVMRYHLLLSKQEKISLNSEFQLIKSYIELEKLRMNENCDLQIQIVHTHFPASIAPLVLLPFIENAFKHGTHPTEPCFVHLHLQIENQQLLLELENSIITQKKVVKTQIGLENTEKRLTLLYPNKHQLSVQKTDKIYALKLRISL